MKSLLKKWSGSLKVFFLVAALLFIFYPSSAEATYSSNLIPVMVGENEEVARASSENPEHPAWHAFDDNPGTFWEATDHEGWLEIELPSPKVVTCYSFYAGEAQWWRLGNGWGHFVPPTIYKFEASNDGNNWIALDSQIISDWGEYGEICRVEIEIDNNVAYKKYRIITDGFLPYYDYGTLCIDQFELYETVGPPYYPPTTVNVNAGNTWNIISWDVVDGATGYNVKRSLNPDGPYIIIASNVSNTTYTDVNLTNNTTYYYIISAIGPTGETRNSSYASGKPVLDKPNLTSTYNVKKASLVWNKIDHATSYKVKKSFHPRRAIYPDWYNYGFLKIYRHQCPGRQYILLCRNSC